MATVSRRARFRVLTLDPLSAELMPVPGARVKVEHDGFWSDPDLGESTSPSGADGRLEVEISFDDDEIGDLLPFFTLTLDAAARQVPAGAPAERRFELPAEWVTRHAANGSARRLLSAAEPLPEMPLLIGLPARLQVAYSDFHASGLRNPVAPPEQSLEVVLLDEDLCFDDALSGVGAGEEIAADGSRRLVIRPAGGAAGEDGDHPFGSYPFIDRWPVARAALADDLATAAAAAPNSRWWLAEPRAWLDPPGAPVASLGGGSFTATGPLTTDDHGFVLLLDGETLRRFYPDGTLCQSQKFADFQSSFLGVEGLATDSRRDLWVARGGLNGDLAVYALDSSADDPYGSAGQYRLASRLDPQTAGFDPLSTTLPQTLRQPADLAIARQRSTASDLMAVADLGRRSVEVFTLGYGSFGGHRLRHVLRITGEPAMDPFQGPNAVAVDGEHRVYVADAPSSRLSCWRIEGQNAVLVWQRSIESAPLELALDAKHGYLYVLRQDSAEILRLNTADGTLHLRLTPSSDPRSLAVDNRGELYVADRQPATVRRLSPYNPAGARRGDQTVPSMVGEAWQPATAAQHMVGPGYVFFDPQGALWVSDTGNDRVQLFERDGDGRLLLQASIDAGLSQPHGVATAADGSVFVASFGDSTVRRFDPSLNAVGEVGEGFNQPRGLAIGQRGEQEVLAVADSGNNRVRLLRLDGTLIEDLSGHAGSDFAAPEDVAFGAAGELLVADTGNARVLRLPAPGDAGEVDDEDIDVETGPMIFTPAAVGFGLVEPSGLAVDSAGSLLVADRGAHRLLAFARDGLLTGFWDLQNLPDLSLAGSIRASLKGTVSLNVPRLATPEAYLGGLARRVEVAGRVTVTSADGNSQTEDLPVDSLVLVEDGEQVQEDSELAVVPALELRQVELARLQLFAAPSSVAMDDRGLLAMADGDLHRVRLVRTRGELAFNLFSLGRGLFNELPDIALRWRSRADWRQQLGLRAAVGDNIDAFGEAYREGPPTRDDFAGDELVESRLLGVGSKVNDAVNVLKVLRQTQRWLVHLSAADSADQRWGGQNLDLFVDLRDGISRSHAHWFSDVLALAQDASGRGADAWDDEVVAHEMAHFIFARSLPREQLQVLDSGGEHYRRQLISQDIALTEGFAEYVQLFWGGAERFAGFANLRSLFRRIDGRRHSVGRYDSPELGLESEALFANALWQIHHLLVNPAVGFADSPSYWHPHNHAASAGQQQRFALLRRALRTFSTAGQAGIGSSSFWRRLLDLVRAELPERLEAVRFILEANNLLLPRMTLGQHGTDSAMGASVDGSIELATGAELELAVGLRDALDRPLRGYQIRFEVDPETAAAVELRAGSGPEARHGLGLRSFEFGNIKARATNAGGLVPFTLKAGAATGSARLTLSTTSDLSSDAVLAPPLPTDSWQTTLEKLYLAALSRQFPAEGATVKRQLEIRIS